MPERTVVINHVTLTESQLRAAVRELDRPRFKPGDRVRKIHYPTSRGVVMTRTISTFLSNEYPSLGEDADFWVMQIGSDNCWSETEGPWELDPDAR